MNRRAVRFSLASPDADALLDEQMDLYQNGPERAEGEDGTEETDEAERSAQDFSQASSISQGNSLGENEAEEKDLPRVLSVQMHELTNTVSDVVLEQFAPVSLVLTSSDSSTHFRSSVQRELIHQDTVLSIRPSTEFTTAGGMQRILSLQLRNDPHEACEAEEIPTRSGEAEDREDLDRTRSSFGQKLQSSCAVDLHTMPLSVGATGALLSHLTRIETSYDHSEGPDDASGHKTGSSSLRIASIESIVLQNCLSISTESRIALDIFGEEGHASFHTASRKREGLSLFGILDTTRTPLSRPLLRRWLLLPSTEIEVIKSRQAAVSAFTQHRNQPVVQSMGRELKGVKNLPKMMTKLSNGTAKLPDWKAVLTFCYHCTVLRELTHDLLVDERLEIVQKIRSICDRNILNFCADSIALVIDFEESATEARICIKSGFDEELDQWKQLYAGLPDLLNKIAQDIRPDVDPTYSEISVCYFPQLGYLLAVPIVEQHRGNLPSLEGWEFQFSSENAMYFKGEKMRDLDVHLGDIHSFIVEREIEHASSLQEAICEHGAALLQMAELLAELDCLLSLADASGRFEWTRPEVTEDNIIEIYQGRHALQELTVDSFVPNDAYLQAQPRPHSSSVDMDQDPVSAAQNRSLLIVTGSNGSGKSVYLKQIALIVILAHIGSFVPAQGARIGICDQNGAALFAATIRYLLERPGGCPKTIVATHFHALLLEDDLGQGDASIDETTSSGNLQAVSTIATQRRERVEKLQAAERRVRTFLEWDLDALDLDDDGDELQSIGTAATGADIVRSRLREIMEDDMTIAGSREA
ncbi:hypothetical protein OC861_000813 [Tilletia horrida]|nr:hypothetical protein OC861_000813 [Tilletia horrida]